VGKTARRLNGWNVAETGVLLFVTAGQVLLLRSFQYKTRGGGAGGGARGESFV